MNLTPMNKTEAAAVALLKKGKTPRDDARDILIDMLLREMEKKG